MSWFSDNYEKAILGGAAVITLGLGFSIFTGNDDAFAAEQARPNNDVAVPGLDLINETKGSLSATHEIIVADVDGRKVDLFTGVPLFVKKGDPDHPVDLLKSEAVHTGIDNTWWLKYKIDPGFSDSPERDEDKDGFTNREEYVAGTDPTDPKIHPDPVHKLKLLSISTTQVHIKPQEFGPNQFMFKLENKYERRRNKMGQKPIGPGVIIPFEGKLMKDRFKFLEVEKQKDERTGMQIKIWVFEDQKPNKKGDIYKFTQRGELEGLRNRSKGIMDSTVKLELQALGQEGKPFEIEEGTRFSLPYNEKATEKPYLLRKIDLGKKLAEVEYTDKDGNEKIHTMPFK